MDIGINTSLSQAQMGGLDIFEYDPASRGAEHYTALAAHVTELLEG